MMAPITEVFFCFVSIVCLMLAMVAHPTRATCPTGWYLSMGIRRSGEFLCQPVPVGGDDDVLTGKDTAYQPPGTIHGRLYCTGGAQPIVDIRTGRSVGCQRVH